MRNILATAQKLFDATQAGLVGQEITLPKAQFLAQGLSAWDAEQFTVSFMTAYGGQPNQTEGWQIPGSQIYFGDFRIEILRDAPVPQGRATPSASKQAAASAETYADVEALLTVLNTISADGSVVDRGIHFGISSVGIQGPDGGFCGAIGIVTIGLM